MQASCMIRAAPCSLEYPNQGHWVVGQPGWERVADDAATWLDGKTV